MVATRLPRFAICQEAFADWAFTDICSIVGKLGYEGLELAPFMFGDDVRDVSASARRELQATATRSGLAITGLHWLLLKPDGLRLSDPDPAVRGRAATYLKALADFCSDVGGSIMTLGSPKQRSIPPGSSYSDAWAWACDLLREVGAHCVERGVILCLEALPPADTDFLMTADETVRLASAVASPGVAMMLDVKSMCAECAAEAEGQGEGEPAQARQPKDIISSCSGAFEHFHANDANRRGPGLGDVDFVPIFKALLDVGYEKWVSVEAFDFQPSPEYVAKESLRYMKACLRVAANR